MATPATHDHEPHTGPTHTGQAHADWTKAGFMPAEHHKLARLLDLCGVRPGMRILEPGCGTGRLTLILGTLVGPEGAVTALDREARMVEIAARRCAGLGLPGIGQMTVLQADAQTWTPEAPDFDLVVYHQVFTGFSDQAGTLRRLGRGLRSSGRLVISQFVPRRKTNSLAPGAGAAASGPAEGGPMGAGPPGTLSPGVLPDEPDMRALLDRAGFLVESLDDTREGYFLEARRTP